MQLTSLYEAYVVAQTSDSQVHAIATTHTVDWESLKYFHGRDQPRKLNTRKIKLRGDDQ